MDRAHRLGLGASIVAVSLALVPRSAAAESCHGVAMPEQITVNDQTLILNGMGSREATVLNVDVYVAGLYLTAPARSGEEVLRDMGLMRIALQLVRDVERDDMTEAIEDGLKRNVGDNMAAFTGRGARLEQMIPDLRKGDTVAFTYLPDQKSLVLQVNGQERGRVAGTDFARAFFSIWLAKPPNEGLKRGLLGAGC
jgi:hypothetical protein